MRTKNEIVSVLTGALQFLPEENEITDDLIEVINQVEEDLKYAEARYKSLEEHFNNGVAYATKIQEELNVLKKDVARFLVLFDKACRQTQTTEEMHERWTLEEKFRKIGKTNE